MPTTRQLRQQHRCTCSHATSESTPSSSARAYQAAPGVADPGAARGDEGYALQRDDPYAEMARQLQKLSDNELSMRESFARRISDLEGAVKSACNELSDLRAREEQLARTLSDVSLPLHAERQLQPGPSTKRPADCG
eukprot:CAMPEP_0119368476 /NCGR_PEP_ID=MMETSP1334-20130426/15121_1 /TAXON_ID=127549 /ORGANISM="Calcidiscus leptoporus, Strain RCC1130" /LENGTH=136 /DNA_ID=CAMNT_0007385121 /DNA_START=142 /DNA_END=552 /DNA_ORIENTATION=-